MKEQEVEERSCGCIVVKDNKFLLVQLHNGDWGFPKGHMEEGETEKETALRETKEEASIDAIILNDKRYVQEYVTDRGKNKRVVYFYSTTNNTNAKPQEAEVQNIEWLEYSKARERLSYENTKNILDELVKDIK